MVIFVTKKYSLLVLAASSLLIISIYGIASVFPFGPDWTDTFRPAAVAVLHNDDPYDVEEFMIVPWVLLPILPLALFSEAIGGAIFFIAGITGYGYAAYKFGAKPLALGAFLLSPPVLHNLLNGNIDWIPLVGATLPPQIGLFFVITKPQIGFTMVLFWLVETWRQEKLRGVIRVFAPVTLALLMSIVIWEFWFLKWLDQPSTWWNASLFPWTVPIGVGLLYWGIFRERKREYVLPAGPCLSPYVLFHSWSAAIIAIVSHQKATLAIVAALWALVLFRALS